jgi:prophage antirepressor-like protein
MQVQPEKGKAPVALTTEALSEANPYHKESNMSDSKAVQVSSQPVFNFGAHSVRVVVRDGEPWFVASDVCAALDYKNTSKAVADHLDDDERMTVAARDSHSNDSNQSLESKGTHIVSPLRSRGGARHTVVINESGLYALVLRSRKPEARKFAKWVTSEVLPAIRKTGIYVGKPFTVNPGDVLTAEEQNTLRLMLKTAVERLPKEKQAGAMIKGWSKLKAHFGVAYREIPRQEFSEFRSSLATLRSGRCLMQHRQRKRSMRR